MLARVAACLTAFLLLGLSACASLSPLREGMTRDEVLRLRGMPQRVVPLGAGADAGTRFQYSGQPAGQFALMVDFDAAGRLTAARQVLNAQDFERIQVGTWTRADVEREFGPPASIDRVAAWPHDIMTYRWRSVQDMFYWVYLDQNNVVRRAHPGVDETVKIFPDAH